jgi:hypothetical protein
MTNFLFWNVNRNDVAGVIAVACKEYEVDVLILAENRSSTPHLLKAINQGDQGRATYVAPFELSPRLTFITRYPLACLQPVLDDGGIAVRRLRPPIGVELLLIALHLPSKLHRKEVEQTLYSTRLADLVTDLERQAGHSNSLVIGDLNMDAFEDGMVAADGFHGVMDRTIARKISRTVDGKLRKFFYNPMWSRYGDETDRPPGTYYYRRSGQISRYWHMFDQVLLRPSLLDYYNPSGLQIIQKVGSHNLVSGGKIDTSVSDHLPIFLRLELERGV